MTIKEYESVLSLTQAKLVELEQQVALMNQQAAQKEAAQQRQSARACLADFLHCVEHNQAPH